MLPPTRVCPTQPARAARRCERRRSTRAFFCFTFIHGGEMPRQTAAPGVRRSRCSQVMRTPHYLSSPDSPGIAAGVFLAGAAFGREATPRC